MSPGPLKRASTKVSASLLYNNLSANGRSCAYVHHSEVLICPDSAVTSGSGSMTISRLPDKDNAVIKQARFVEVSGGEYLVVASQRSLQVYSADAKRVLHHQPVLSGGTPDSPSFFRGIAACTVGGDDYICAGCSAGEIVLIPCTGGQFKPHVVLKEQSTPICDLAAAPSPEGGDEAMLASADSAGLMVVLAVGMSGVSRVHASFGGDANAVCTALRIRRQLLLSAYSTGHVRIHDLLGKCLMVQIAAHARWVNTLELHPTKDVMATAGEDCTVSVWRLPDTSPGGCTQVKHLGTTLVPDALLCGVAFCGGHARDHVACTAYDVEAIHAFQFE